MINLKRNQNNDVIFTLTEKESNYSGSYLMDLTNSQSNVTISGITLEDISLYTARYNEFYIVLSTLLSEFTVTSDITLNADSIYFIASNIIVDEGVTLTIPANTYIIQGSAFDIINDGTIVNEGNIIQDSDITTTVETFTDSGVTYIFDLLSGYYDYEIKTADGLTTLEIGKILVGPDTESTTTYSTTDSTYIYNEE